MRRIFLLLIAAVAGGLLLGTLLGRSLPASAPRTSAYSNSAVLASARYAESAPSPSPIDLEDSARLLERADDVLELLKEEDYPTLSQLIHPEKGVTFTPYSTVSADYDRTLSPEEISALPYDDSLYVWGVADGSGAPIYVTSMDYFQRYVYNADFTQAPNVGVDTVMMSGNALENIALAYPEGRFVDYCFPGIDPQLEGFDWCSLKLVFEPWQGDWYLVGIVHSEWTI